MVTLNLAYTAPVNPPSTTPVLTPSQLWAGLQLKVRRAQDFVPLIGACEVVRDEDGVVERDVMFKADMGKKVREVVKSYEPARVDFHQSEGSVVSNIISDGAGGPEDLYMTYCFEWHHPDLEAGSEEAEKEMQTKKGMSKMAVEKSIETIREMVKDGRIK